MVKEVVLRWWASAGTIILIVFLMIPNEAKRWIAEELSTPSSITQYSISILVVGGFLILVLAFYFLMLYECGFSKGLRYQSFWLLFIILVPLVSSFIYYWVTRSKLYAKHLQSHDQRI